MTRTLSALELKEWQDDAARDAPLIIDVREPWEHEVCQIPGARLLPMSDIPDKCHQLPRDNDIVVVCHHGMRSLQVANYLAHAGFGRVYNLSGGIAAWATQVDPAMPKY